MIAVDKLINDQAVLNPDKEAIKHGKRTITYKELEERSNRLARYFREKGVNYGDTVGLAIDRSPEMVIAILAIVKAGAAYLPIDNKFPIERVDYMLNDAAVKVLITSKDYKDKYHAHPLMLVDDVFEITKDYDTSYFPSNVDEESVAYILYTSGSTGKPKGVEVKHLGLSNLLISIQRALKVTKDDILPNITTISFDIAELEVYLPLISGALLVIINQDDVKDGRALIEIAEAEKVTIMQGTPFMWRTMLQAGWERPLNARIISGGEAMPKELAMSLIPLCKEYWNMYGPTETTIYSTFKKVSADDEIITIGVPIDNTGIFILDEDLNELPHGESGEIWINGDGVAKGYRNKPELTAEKFLDDKFGTGGKMYKSGDLGRILPNGEIQCLGRSDHQIKIRGYRIETEEVEFQIKQQENVRVAVTILYTDVLGNPHLVAYVVPENQVKKEDTRAYIDNIKKGIAAALPEYMVPDTFMVIDAIPLNSNGKIDRKALPEPIINQESSAEYQAPETETEQILADIFLSKIAIKKIGIDDNFFELGMNSLIAVAVMVQVEKKFGKRFPLSILLKYSNIRKFAQLIESGDNDWPYHSLIPIKPEGTKTPLYIVHGIGLNLLNVTKMVFDLDKDQPVFGFQSVGLDGTMEPFDTMEGIAKFYVDELLAHNANGPYLIAGYSFGGVIAFEMVRQLKEMGKDIGIIIMFDTNMQIPSHLYPVGKKLRVKFIRQFKKVGFRIYTAFTQPGHLFKYLKSDYNTRFNQFLSNVGLIDGDYHPENMPRFMQDIVAKLDKAHYNYMPKPLDVKLILFKAAIRMFFVDNSKYLGWKKYALKGVEVHNVPGDHRSMFQSEKEAADLAKSVQACLDKLS